MNHRRLQVVDPNHELRGLGPPAFERLARAAEEGSPAHRGLVAICTTLASRAVSACLPPSAQVEVIAALETSRLWIRGDASAGEVKSARARCFQAVSGIEEITSQAVARAKSHLGRGAASPLDLHADHVVDRYARLAAHFSVSAVCHSLDAIESPSAALEVLGDVEGARAYQLSGLGSARHPAFRKAAWDQAEWEASRPPRSDPAVLAVQVFHEYLGGRWRRHADALRHETESFLSWALSARAARL